MSPTFRSLRVPNYRRFAVGQLLANTGVWMQRVAQDWLVLELTDGSPLALGITVGLQFLPMLLFGLWGGGLADRFRRRRMLLVTSTLMGSLALVMGAIVLLGLATVPLVMFLAFALGAVAAVDHPARQAFVSEMVDRQDLPNAVALSTASFNLGRVFGPAVAGLLIAAVGTGWVFVINALGYAAVVVALLGIQVSQLQSPEPVVRRGGELREGLRYVWARPELVLVLMVAFFVGTFGLNFQLTIASMTTVEFGLGPAAFGLASTVLAVGSLGGSLAAASRGEPRLRLVVLAAVGFGAAGVTVALMPTYLAFLVALPLVGVGALTLINSAQSYLQLNSDPQMRGRVMGIYTLLFLGGTPVGSPLVGWVAESLGPRWSIALGGLVSAVAALAAAAYRLRSTGQAVRAHLTPRPHLHIGTPSDLATIRRGPGIAMGTHAVVLPLVLAGALLGGPLLAVPGAGSSPRQASESELPTREVAVVQDPRIDEASGMAVSRRHRDLVWIINDSRNGPYVFGVDGEGETVARLTVADAENRDWEAMAPGVDDNGEPVLWIADIGDNDSQWDSVRLYRIAEPKRLGNQTVAAREYTLQYPDGAHNAEALLVEPDNGAVYIVTKQALGAGIYATEGPPVAGETETLTRVGSAPMFITDGALSPDGSHVALRSYSYVYLYESERVLNDKKHPLDRFRLPRQPQGETLAYLRDGKGVLVGSEGVESILYEVTLPVFETDETTESPTTESPTTESAEASDPEVPVIPAAEDTSSSAPLLALGLVALIVISFGTAAVLAIRSRSKPR